jgi:hypothetical protein
MLDLELNKNTLNMKITFSSQLLLFLCLLLTTTAHAQYNPGAGLEVVFGAMIVGALLAFALVVFIIVKIISKK